VRAGARELGTVSDVLAYPSNDVLEVRAGEGSEPVFVPFVDDVVTQVDVVGRVVGVREDFL
jgi:ribosomal 30S subunit maturation factor RimM